MIETPPQPQALQGLAKNDESLLETIASAVERPLALWRCVNRGLEDAPCEWLPAAYPAGSSLSERLAPAELLEQAAASDAPVWSEAEPGGVLLAFRLETRGAVGVVQSSKQEAALLTRLIERVVSETRATQLADELQDENDAFAEQLASDLEELTFLRAMVDNLSGSRVDDEAIELARKQLAAASKQSQD